MKSYREIADKVFERRDKYLVAKKLKKKKIIKRTGAAFCALVVLLGISAWHLGWFGVDRIRGSSQSNLPYGDSQGILNTVEITSSTTTTTKATTTKDAVLKTTQSQKTTQTIYVPKLTIPRPLSPLDTTTRKGTEWLDYTKGACLELEYSVPVDWATEGDLVHIAFKKARYVCIDATSRKVIKNVVLPSTPSNMRIIGEEIWVSFPALKKIIVYNKSDVSMKRGIDLAYEPLRFDVYGDYLVYCVGEQYMRVYRYNLSTQSLDVIETNGKYHQAGGYRFGEGEVLINSDENVFYVGEAKSTGDKLYCYDLETLELKSYYETDPKWADINKYKQMYICEGKLYWSKFCMDATDVSKVERTYSGFNSSGMVYVDERYVINIVGIYVRNGKQLHYLNMQSSTKGAVITESGHLIVIENGAVYIVRNLL